MNINKIPAVFNRALALTFKLKKLVIAFIVLAFSGLLIVFFRGLSIGAGDWVLMSLTFLPFFLCAGIMLSMGVFLIRVYHNEVKGKTDRYSAVLYRSWEVILGASYFSVPIVLSYLLLWIVLGFFLLLQKIPGVGDVIGVILAFGPFLLNLCILVLCLMNLGMLFFLTPVIALKGLNRIHMTQALINRFKGDIFANIILFVLSLFPIAIVGGLLTIAATMTTASELIRSPLHLVLQSFFIMIPFAALIAPAIVFFFNFAAEAHVLTKKE